MQHFFFFKLTVIFFLSLTNSVLILRCFFNAVISVFMNSVTVQETVLKSPHKNTWPRFHVRLPNDAAAFLLKHSAAVCSFVQMCKKCVFFLCVSVCVSEREKCACALDRLPGVLFKLCIKAWLTSQHTSQSLPAMTSRRHRWDLVVAYHRSDRVWKSSPHRVCIVTCWSNAL